MKRTQRVLVTGAAGTLGRAACAALVARGHEVTAFDVRPSEGVDRQVIASLADGESIYAAAQGQDCVIHLAATPDDASFPRLPPPDDGDNFLAELLPNNLVGVYHLMEAARKNNVAKLVLASSGQVVWIQSFEGPLPVKADSPICPRYWYAATKAFLESIGFSYSHYHNLAILAVRLGWCPRPGQEEEIAASERAQDVYLSPADAGRFFVRSVEADFEGFHIIYATSRPRRIERLDLSGARRIVGFEPEDVWPVGTRFAD